MGIYDALRLLEMDCSWVEKIQNSKSYKEACKVAEEFKVAVKKQKRKVLLKYHPDTNGGSKEAEEKTKLILNVCHGLENLQVKMPAPVTRVYVRRYYSYGEGTTASSTSTSVWW